MPETPAIRKVKMWPKGNAIYVETVVIIFLAIVSMSLQYSKFDSTILLSPELGIRIIGSLCIWFGNIFTLDHLLQSRIDSDKVSYQMTIIMQYPEQLRAIYV